MTVGSRMPDDHSFSFGSRENDTKPFAVSLDVQTQVLLKCRVTWRTGRGKKLKWLKKLLKISGMLSLTQS